MRILILLPLVMVFPFLAFAQTPTAGCGFFTVPPGSGALVLDRRGNVMRKVDAGLHSCVPVYQNVLIEKTHSERQMDVENVWRDEPCEITVSVIWSISDLEDYYTKGGETTAASGIEKQVQEALATAEISDIGMEAIPQYLHATLRENSLAFEEFGVKFHRTARSSFRNCIKE